MEETEVKETEGKVIPMDVVEALMGKERYEKLMGEFEKEFEKGFVFIRDENGKIVAGRELHDNINDVIIYDFDKLGKILGE